MIPQEEAQSIIQSSVFQLNTNEIVSIFNCLERVLFHDIISDINMPPFNKSAMDGYACKLSDIHEPMQVLEIIAAGSLPTMTIEKGKCSKIMTGAMIPLGADCVIKVEDTIELNQNTIQFTKNTTSTNICFEGEDFKQNTLLIEKGTLLKPQHIPVLATAGYSEVSVYAKTKVAIISTGDELVEPSEKPSLGKIRNSNAYQLYAQCVNAGAAPKYYGIALDNENSLNEIISKAHSECQITILTGGVSMGDFDFVPKILVEQGFDIKFKSIAVQPGRPTLFGVNIDKFCFGLPGNPVSSFVQFELMVKPLIKKLQGEKIDYSENMVNFNGNYKRINCDRKAWIPVFVDNEQNARIINYNGSAHINAYTQANAMMEIKIGVTEIENGEKINVRFI